MKSLTAVACGFLLLSGCACSRKEKLYKQALADTNASLTQCRDENASLHRVVQQYHKEIQLYKKNRQSDAFKRKGGHR